MADDEDVYVKIYVGEWEETDMGPQVASIDVEDRDVGTDMATLILDDTGGVNSIGVDVGQKIHIVMGWATEYALLFVGRVREREVLSADRGRLKLICYDESVRMSNAPEDTGRTHAGTLESILAAIVAPYDILLGGVQIDPMPSWTEDDPIRQRSRSDWTLIQQLARTHNARAFIEPNAVEGEPPQPGTPPGSPQLYFIHQDNLLAQDPSGRLTYCHGFSDLISFEFRDVGRSAAPSAQGVVIDPITGEPCPEAGPEPAASDPAVPSDNQVQRAEAADGPLSEGEMATRAQHAAEAEIRPQELRPRSHVTGQPSSCAAARQRIQPDRTRLLGYHGNGMANGSVKIRAKDTVVIDGLPTNASGAWYLKKVNHLMQRTQIEDQVRATYRTRIVATR